MGVEDDRAREKKLEAAIQSTVPRERLFVFDTDDHDDLLVLASAIARFCNADRLRIAVAYERGAFVARHGDEVFEEATDGEVDSTSLDILLRVLNLALEVARAPEVLVTFTTTYTDYVALVNAKEERLLKRGGVRVHDP